VISQPVKKVLSRWKYNARVVASPNDAELKEAREEASADADRSDGDQDEERQDQLLKKRERNLDVVHPGGQVVSVVGERVWHRLRKVVRFRTCRGTELRRPRDLNEISKRTVFSVGQSQSIQSPDHLDGQQCTEKVQLSSRQQADEFPPTLDMPAPMSKRNASQR
jgi:hypothetical protein